MNGMEGISEEWSTLTMDPSSFSVEFFHWGSTMRAEDINERNTTDLLFVYLDHSYQYFNGDRCEMTIRGKINEGEVITVHTCAREASRHWFSILTEFYILITKRKST